jgi:hypothetical protein
MQIVPITATFTRPADTTAYTTGDLVANSTTAGSVVPMSFFVPGANGFKLWRVSVSANSATDTNAKFRLHLYSSATITAANGDNGAWSTTSSGYLGFVDVDASGEAFTDNLTGWGTYLVSSVNVPLLFALTSHKVYGLLSATAAYTPTSAEVFTVTLLGEAYV